MLTPRYKTNRASLVAPAPRQRLRFSSAARRAAVISAAALLLCCSAALPAPAADDLGWEYSPYRIHATLATDLPGGLAQQLADELPHYLQQRASAALGPLWSLDVQLAGRVERQRVFADVAAPADSEPPDMPSGRDKLLLIALRYTPEGYDLTAREFDRYTARWGLPIRREARQAQALPEQLFALLCQAVSPLAQYELDPEDEERVVLRPRGAALTRGRADAPWAAPGDVFLPLLRRTARGGELLEGGIQAVPWTYVEVVQLRDETAVARIHSGTRRPFGVRRIGHVEQVAIGLRADPAETVLRVHSRTAPAKALIGYEVFAQNPQVAVADGGSEGADPNAGVLRVGMTDREGKLTVPPGDSPVRVLYLRNGGQLLARLPVVPGAEPQIDVPLPDDDPRLAAENRLAALREELIDVVARRNILMARARQKLEQNDLDAARRLLATIEELPGRSHFNLTLTNTARLLRSEDPQIQRRIDQLFEATQTVLNQYLDTRPVTQLHDELRTAQQKGG